MGQVIVSLAAMFASLTLFIAGTSLLTTVVAVELGVDGLSTLQVGLVLGCHSVGFVIGSLFATRLVRRVGQVRSFAAFAAVACSASLIHPLFFDGALWAVLRVLVGFCAAGLIMVLESWISGRATHATRGALLGIYQVVFFFAAALGQYLVSLGETDDYPIYTIVAILIVMSLVPLALTRSEAPAPDTADRLRFRQLYALSPSGLLGGIAGGALVAGFSTLAPVYASDIGMSLAEVSRYMAFAVLATMAIQWPIGRLSDHFDRRLTVAAISTIATLAGIAAAVVGAHDLRVLYVATAPLFGLAACLYPISLSMINDNMDRGDPISASAGLLLAYGVGTCIGPVAGAVFMQGLGPAGLFVFLAGVFALYSLFVFWRGFTTPSVPVADQSRFVTIVAANTSPAILELDPRHELYMETPHIFDELHAGPAPGVEPAESPTKADGPGV
ncbi:Major facilitator superfamily MFS_1 [Salinisphaera sp. S4-8]|uniref:MFS transporter n=1 Tax=Salinisphaera sp. S4-8 TaxID=633357 RepID=UPI00333E75E9